jgi:alpha-L-rhamnosidase
VTGAYESPYGQIGSEWRLEGGGRLLAYEATIPANSQATLHLPAAPADSVREGRTPLARVDGVSFLGHTGGVASYRLPSGTYRLTSRLDTQQIRARHFAPTPSQRSLPESSS